MSLDYFGVRKNLPLAGLGTPARTDCATPARALWGHRRINGSRPQGLLTRNTEEKEQPRLLLGFLSLELETGACHDTTM
jgi:hypothetical protein